MLLRYLKPFLSSGAARPKESAILWQLRETLLLLVLLLSFLHLLPHT